MADNNTANSTAVESLIQRDKVITIIAIAVLVGATLTYTVLGVGMNMSAIQMTPGLGQSQMSMPKMSAMKNMAATPAVWTFNYSVLMFFMWWTMMIAMMLPSASPMILLYTALIRRTKKTKSIIRQVTSFICGYLLAWAAFSLFAAALQSQLELRDWMSPMMMEATNIYLAAGILIAAGVYQLTPLKTVCLEKCRQPASFLANYKNTWVNSPLRIGLVHGFYCVGCCWFLMGLLFFGGIMNLYWIVGLIIFVAIEKLHEKGVIFGKILGGGAIFLGIAFLINS
jgi:predicted metal-binding membrane protein